jgi:hypothetical protein
MDEEKNLIQDPDETKPVPTVDEIIFEIEKLRHETYYFQKLIDEL